MLSNSKSLTVSVLLDGFHQGINGFEFFQDIRRFLTELLAGLLAGLLAEFVVCVLGHTVFIAPKRKPVNSF